jgi:cytochrome c oxidase subunit 1
MIDADPRERARRLTLGYLRASTLILLVTGLMGLVLRSSQAGWGRIGDNTWYAFMTAHGLGAFLGWAGFAVMGLSWWVLNSVGFPFRPLGYSLARLTYWLMIAGVAGVVVTTLLMHFAASWVFLYPLPFHSAGQWSETASGLFNLSVLLVGLSIVTWCLAILHTVLGPPLHAVSSSVFNRLGVAMGFGYLWPSRFATNPEPVPYAVIPLTVIAVDMIIATLPLAVLLVEMIVQSWAPGLHVDPLLAKNVLWWFGHPVVYLLLFPAVAVYYWLIPRYAKRPLVAGNVIAIAWAVAVVANVFVWAHHVYLDYPLGSAQAAINTAMEPTTFALVLPSALSLYSLGFTIYRSDFEWTAASTALFLGLVSWLLAGLSGIVNATIVFDTAVHNTLWVVGHFHHMALLNIGLLIFGAIYALLPELTGKPIWSEAMARWHVWLTFLAGMANSALWMWQGLEGAPRRFAILPHHYESLAKAAVPVVAVLGFAQLLFVVNMVQTLRGAGVRTTVPGGRIRRAPNESAAEAKIALAVLSLMLVSAVVGFAIGRATREEPARPAARAADPGKAIFDTAGCGGCHTLRAAGAAGKIGPNLDTAHPSVQLALDRVSHGKGAMPAFQGRLNPTQIQQVAAFVANSAGR